MRFFDLEILNPPADPEVVTVQEYIDHARLNGITTSLQPDLIARQLAAATARAEAFCRRSLLRQTLKALFVLDGKDCSCALKLALPRGQVDSVMTITSNGQAVTDFTLAWNVVTLAAPLSAPAEVVFVSAGFGDAGAMVPQPIREGILEYATTLYEDRTGKREAKYQASFSKLPPGVADLWRPFQLELGG